MNTKPANTTMHTEPERSVVVAQKRRVIKSRSLEPLDPERRYVQPDTARVALCHGIFAWVRPLHGRKVKVKNRGMESNGLSAPTVHSREKAKFNDYFELGTGIKIKPGNVNWELNVHRNRIIFLAATIAVVLYCIYWASGG
ncbi:MAG: hypothetical protein JJU29_02935 [Verrucomicrobia bacterium]|nr:hypothetical protein [Verrucomicrobiota bacterium]MCH8511128.1 hypothetical protein [Kiritimatiellia bacterium]